MSENIPVDDVAGDGRDFITIHAVAPIDEDEHPELVEEILESRTQPGSQTGYMMRFGDLEHRGLNPFDVISLPGKSYPVSESALDSLPAFVRANLEQDGSVQIIANYDPDEGIFSDVSFKWEERSTIDRIAELMGMGRSLHEAVDWIVVEEEEAFTLAQWADIRGVTDEAIKTSLRTVRRALHEREEDENEE